MAGIELVAPSQPEPTRIRWSGPPIFGAICFLAAGAALGYFLRPQDPAAPRVHRVQLSAIQGQDSLVYGAVVAVAALLLLLLIRASIGKFRWPFGRARRFAGRRQRPVAEFVAEAKAIQIGLRVAREGYDLLQHHYPRPMCIELSDNLRRDLKLTEQNIGALYADMLGRTDRLTNREADVTGIETVRDLFEQVEHAPMEAVDRTAMRLRTKDLPFPARPIVENIEFTKSTPVVDPDFLRRPHFNWLRRRDSDHKGLRSRATDNEAGSQHVGPFRRAHDAARKRALQAKSGRNRERSGGTGSGQIR